MVDFTSALYLGFRHPTASLGSWTSLSLGQPAALREPPDAEAVATGVARLQGCEAGTLLSSTLHLFWDLFGMFAKERVAVFCDGAAYPVARWGAAALSLAGVPIQTLPHRSGRGLRALLEQARARELRPVILTDGYCAGCGTPAPLGAYSELVRRHEGYLVIDDTQALGILGANPSAENPYGRNGGGSLRWHGISGPHIVIGSSLAKAFGAPLAVLAGSASFIERFRAQSQTRVHCSPPASAVIRAARRALELNQQFGERLRARLVALARRLRAGLARAGLAPATETPFPMQTFRTREPKCLALLHERLRRFGIEALLTRGCGPLATGLTFLVNPRHGLADVELPGRIAAEFIASGTGLECA
jgi:8-amino-7-oxononanoate synthase